MTSSTLPTDPTGKMDWRFFRHERNQGKGAALRTAIEHAECELQMVPLFLQENVDAVFGSRFLAGVVKRTLFFKHSVGNHILTFLCDFASDLNLTNMEPCYKMVRTYLGLPHRGDCHLWVVGSLCRAAKSGPCRCFTPLFRIICVRCDLGVFPACFG